MQLRYNRSASSQLQQQLLGKQRSFATTACHLASTAQSLHDHLGEFSLIGYEPS
jgi:hypothetical protein